MREDAFKWLGRAIALGNANVPCFEHDPNWSSLRNDPKFTELMSKVRAEHAARGIKAAPTS
jgi:hypothetical protein